MSYKASVLYDYPIAYYPLDDLTTVDLVSDFTDFLSQFSTYQDVLDNVSSYANIYGDIAYDHSGCENDGNYIGDPAPDLVPLVAGNSRATNVTNSNSIIYNINNDYTASATTSQFGTAESSDNDFTIELWFYPSFTTTEETPIVADPTNEIGVFYEKGNITFKVGSEQVSYTLPFINKAFYIACTYNPNYISLYVDGEVVAEKILSNFLFTNSSISLQSGPTSSANDYFLINSVAIYRYALSQQAMQYHIEEAQSLPAINVASPDGGEVFSIFDNDLTTVYKFSYPTDKSWNELIETGLTYFSEDDSLQITYTSTPSSSTVVIDDYFVVPSISSADSSKVKWYGDNGVSISVSTDGITYTPCVNNQQIPGYTLTNFGSLSGIYIRITFTSTDTSKFLPKLYNLSFSFFNDQRIYSDNGSSYISTLENESGISNYDITFGNFEENILSRSKMNGLKTVVDSGFNLNTENSVQTIEFFYTPYTLTDSGIISTQATNGYAASAYYWHNVGGISKTNISAIYVNGVNKTSETNVSNVFRVGQLHHVLIVFGSAVGEEIRFNYSLYGSVPASYQNIAIYDTQFNSTLAAQHYDYYRRRSSSSITDSSTTTLTEDGVEAYNNDWIVIQSI